MNPGFFLKAHKARFIRLQENVSDDRGKHPANKEV